jgi:peptide/nickel transport system substrate-binding protein
MIVVLLLAAGACAFEGDRGDAVRQAAPAPRGGTLRVAVPDFWVVNFDLDPQRAYDPIPWELFRCCLLRTLYSYNGRQTEDGGAQLRPDLAAGAPEISPDGLMWTFRLREGLRFAPPFEDTPITALDLVRALERTARVTSPEVGYAFYFEVIRGFEDYSSGAADSIVGLETPDDRTLVVRLDRVTSDLGFRFSLAAAAPIPEGAADVHDADYASFLVASGPYMIEGSARLDPSAPPDEQQPADGFVPPVIENFAVSTPGSLSLVRNPSWDPAMDRLRAAYPDRIEITLGGLDDEEIAGLVDAAEVDLAFGLGGSPFEQVARYRDDPALEDRLFLHPNDAGFAVTMNLAVPPFDDVHVRRAVAYAIDKAALVEILSRPPHLPLGHTAEVATHIAPDALEGSLLRAFDPYPYDPEAARAEMRASAYDRTRDGRCDAPVCRNVRAHVIDLGVNPGLARAIRDDLAELGIELELRIRPQNRFFGDPPELFFRGSIHDPRAQIAMVIPYPWGKDYPDGAGWFQGLFEAPAIPGSNVSLVGASPGQLRKYGYTVTSVPSVDDRLQACLERRGVARTECWAELDQYLMTEVVSRVPYLFMEQTEVVSERVDAYSFDQFAALPALDRIALAPGSE